MIKHHSRQRFILYRCVSSLIKSGEPHSRSLCAILGWVLGVALLQGFGTFSFQVKDAQQFVTQVVGTQGMYRTDDIEARLRAMLLSKLQDLLGETAAKHSVPELIGLTEELGAGVRAKAADDFAAVGLTLKSFYMENLKPSSKSAEELQGDGYAGYDYLYPASGSRCNPRRGSESKRWSRADCWNWCWCRSWTGNGPGFIRNDWNPTCCCPTDQAAPHLQ